MLRTFQRLPLARPAASRGLAFSRPALAKVGDKLPSVDLHDGSPANKVNIATLLAGKKAVVVGLPGAFTPVCSAKHVPGYLAKVDQLKAKGVQEIVVVSVNDGFVMKAWEKDQGVTGKIHFLADTTAELTKKLDLVFDAAPIIEALGNPRCKRFSMVVEDNVIKAVNVAGDNGAPDEVTFVEKVLEQL